MVAPANIVSIRAGHASLAVQFVSGESAVTSAFASNPIKLLTPRTRGRSVWACTSSFGGGLVAGDETRLDLCLGPGARCFVGTQSSTKIYRNPSLLPCGHRTHATLKAGSLLVFAPDPVQAFAGSSYTQRQTFHLEPDASLVLVDWLTSGRSARGERWAFSRFASRNEIRIRSGRPADTQTPKGGNKVPEIGSSQLTDELVFLDSFQLDPADGDFASPHRTGRFNCLATLLFLGPLIGETAEKMLEELSARPVSRRAALVWSASPVRGGAVLRVAGEAVEAVGHELHQHLRALSSLLGDDPWSRKW